MQITIIIGTFIYMIGIITGYMLSRKIKSKEFITFSIVFMWLFLVPVAFFFDKPIPWSFDIVAGMVVTFYLWVATEKWAEALNFIKQFKWKK